MEVRMHPRTEDLQRCITFQLSVSPKTRLFSYRDYLNNYVHHFHIPRLHNRLIIVAESIVDVEEPRRLPEDLGPSAWDKLDSEVHAGDFWEFLRESDFISESAPLHALREELQVYRRDDPLRLVREINQGLFESFYYDTDATQADSPITHALDARKGVCQDFAQIMIALLRLVGIPARYVSGYLFHSKEDTSVEGASHAWVEVFLPELGWTGFDPTNNTSAGIRHIRTAIGRDYADVPPTRGVFRGSATSQLAVSVTVSRSDKFEPAEEELAANEDWTTLLAKDREAELAILRQQQQQQQ
jgi:transglutaminase-like putative cysteine protease